MERSEQEQDDPGLLRSDGPLVYAMATAYVIASMTNEAVIQGKRALGTIIGRKYEKISPDGTHSFARYERTR